MVNEIKIQNGGMLICKIFRKTEKKTSSKIKKAQIKEKFNCKHKHRQIGTKYVKGKKG